MPSCWRACAKPSGIAARTTTAFTSRAWVWGCGGFQSSTSKVDGGPSPIKDRSAWVARDNNEVPIKKALKNLLPAENFELAQDGFWGPYRPLA